MAHLIISQKDEIAYPVGRDMAQTIEIVSQMVEKLRQLYTCSDPIQFVVRGSSGAIISGIASTMMRSHDLKIVHLKKEGESSHSSGASIEADRKVIIIDDLIASGATVNTIYSEVSKHNLEVDTLCVSGSVYTRNLNFKPNNIITGTIKIN